MECKGIYCERAVNQEIDAINDNSEVIWGDEDSAKVRDKFMDYRKGHCGEYILNKNGEKIHDFKALYQYLLDNPVKEGE